MEQEFKKMLKELSEQVMISKEEDRTILDLKPIQKSFLIKLTDGCVADKVCKDEWNNIIENTACQLAGELGKEETKELYPQIDKICSNRPDTFFFFLDKELTPNENKLFKFIQRRYKDYKREVLSEVILKDGKIIGLKEVSVGTLSSTLIHPREVFYEAVKKNADSVLLFHNHPSGSIVPSSVDLEINERLKKGGEVLGIEVLDHIIIGDKIQKIGNEKEKI